VTAAVPEVEAVKVEVHVVAAVVPARVHVVNEPVTPLCERETVPLGETKVPVEVSVTVTVQTEPWLMTTGEVQLTVVEVVLSVKVKATVVEFIVEPLVAVTVAVEL
jgi:hypothetical protein